MPEHGAADSPKPQQISGLNLDNRLSKG